MKLSARNQLPGLVKSESGASPAGQNRLTEWRWRALSPEGTAVCVSVISIVNAMASLRLPADDDACSA